QALVDEAAVATSLTGRVEPADLHDSPSVPVALVLNLPHQLVQRHVLYGLRQPTISQHPTHVQVFQVHRLVFANDGVADLMEMVAPDVGYPLVQLRQLTPCTFPPF